MSQAEQARDLQQLSEGEELQENVTCDACASCAGAAADLVATNKAGDVQCDGRGMINEK